MYFEDISQEAAYRILESRNLKDAIEEQTVMELENFFDQSITLFGQEITKEEIAECGITQLGDTDFTNHMLNNRDKTVFDMLVAEGFLTEIEGINVLSFDYPMQRKGVSV